MNENGQQTPPVEVIVLASGSSGNACLLKVDGFGLLIDLGLGPRKLVTQMKRANLGWPDIQAAILTHTHADHWNDRTLGRLSKMAISFYCHREHQSRLSRYGTGFLQLKEAGLLRYYADDSPMRITDDLDCRPIPVRHDSGAAFGFRFERSESLFAPAWAMGFASDLGTWDERVAESFANVDMLALEFNHDEAMQKNSRRPWQLIQRVLGDEGHLSNNQAAELTAEIVQRSTPNRLRTLIQLHLSRDCNRPDLAQKTAQNLFRELSHSCEIFTASQHNPLEVRDSQSLTRGLT